MCATFSGNPLILATQEPCIPAASAVTGESLPVNSLSTRHFGGQGNACDVRIGNLDHQFPTFPKPVKGQKLNGNYFTQSTLFKKRGVDIALPALQTSIIGPCRQPAARALGSRLPTAAPPPACFPSSTMHSQMCGEQASPKPGLPTRGWRNCVCIHREKGRSAQRRHKRDPGSTGKTQATLLWPQLRGSPTMTNPGVAPDCLLHPSVSEFTSLPEGLAET